LPNTPVGGKIDLEKFSKDRRRPEDKVAWEKFSPFLEKELNNLAEKNNQELPGFLEADGRIAIAGADQASDQYLVSQQETAFAGGAGQVAAWRASQEKNPATLAEKSLTIALSDVLGDSYLVARASQYDDYNNGVDQVIIDKQTGRVLCGFDEVLSRDGSESSQKKEEKLQRSVQKGGARIKYGAAIKDGRLIRAKAENIPAFYLPVSKEELYQLLASQQAGGQPRQTAENQIFSKLLTSLRSQLETVGRQTVVHPQLLNSTKAVLEKLEQINQPAKAA